MRLAACTALLLGATLTAQTPPAKITVSSPRRV